MDLKLNSKWDRVMNLRQVKWAMQHDWFVITCIDANGVMGVEVRNDNPCDPDPLRFFDYQQLRNWAGY